MPLLRLLVVLALPACGCSTNSASRPTAPLPDARELSEHPLDVIGLPQP